MSFHVGQKVVCVDDSITTRTHEHLLRCGELYVVAGHMRTSRNEPGVNILNVGLGFRASRFRPLTEKSTDTGFAILEEIRKRETVPAQPEKVSVTSTIRTEP